MSFVRRIVDVLFRRKGRKRKQDASIYPMF